MKIKGETVQIREIKVVKLHRSNGTGLEIKVCGYPIGIQQEYEALNPKPPVPEKPTGIIRAGKGAEMKADYNDSEWNKKYDEWLFLQKIYYVCKCILSVNPDISFENDYTKIEGLRLIPAELNNAGFSEGDLGAILQAIRDATTIEPAAIEEAKASLQ